MWAEVIEVNSKLNLWRTKLELPVCISILLLKTILLINHVEKNQYNRENSNNLLKYTHYTIPEPSTSECIQERNKTLLFKASITYV